MGEWLIFGKLFLLLVASFQNMFWKHLTVFPIALLLREVKQSQIDRRTSRHVRQNMSPILKKLELSGNNSFPWGALGGVGIPYISMSSYQAELWEAESSVNVCDRYGS